MNQSQLKDYNESKPNEKVCIAKLCGKVDFTEFSSCRHCGASYDLATYRRDHVLRKPPFELGVYIKTPVGFIVMMAVAFLVNAARTGLTASLIGSSIKNSSRELAAFDAKRKYQPLTYDEYIRRGDAFWVHTLTYAARDAYSSAIDLQPRNPLAYEKRAIMYDAIGSNELAESDRRTASQMRSRWRVVSP